MRRSSGPVTPEQRLGAAIAALPGSARHALAEVAAREDLPLVAGSWQDGSGGCLVANVVRSLARGADGAAGLAPVADEQEQTLDLRILALLPELSSRDLNRLIVVWDEAAADAGAASDAALRRLLRAALAAAGAPQGGPRRRGERGGGGLSPQQPPVGAAAGAGG